MQHKQEKQNKKKRLVAGLVGGGLAVATLGAAMGAGNTFALWSDTVSTPGQNIQTGNLDVEAGTAVFANKGVTITPANFRMVPTDVVTTTVPLKIALEGNNLKAAFKVSYDNSANATAVTDAAGTTTVRTNADDAAIVPAEFTSTYEVQKTDGTVVASGTAGSESSALTLTPADVNQVTLNGGGVENYKVVVTTTFEDVANQNRHNVQAVLDTLNSAKVTLAQV